MYHYIVLLVLFFTNQNHGSAVVDSPSAISKGSSSNSNSAITVHDSSLPIIELSKDAEDKKDSSPNALEKNNVSSLLTLSLAKISLARRRLSVSQADMEKSRRASLNSENTDSKTFSDSISKFFSEDEVTPSASASSK